MVLLNPFFIHISVKNEDYFDVLNGTFSLSASDQYDLDFEPQGDLKKVSDGFKEFTSGIE
jgi:hypothetical protein